MAPPNPNSLKTAKRVMAAIDDLQDKKGLTIEAITDHIENEFSVPNSKFAKHPTKAIDRGVAFGAVRKLKGRYFLGEVMVKVRSHRKRRKRGGRRRRSRNGNANAGRKRRRRRH